MKNTKKPAPLPPVFMAFDTTGHYTIIKIEDISYLRTIGKNSEVAIGLKNGCQFKFCKEIITDFFNETFPDEDTPMELAETAYRLILAKLENPKIDIF